MCDTLIAASVLKYALLSLCNNRMKVLHQANRIMPSLIESAITLLTCCLTYLSSEYVHCLSTFFISASYHGVYPCVLKMLLNCVDASIYRQYIFVIIYRDAVEIDNGCNNNSHETFLRYWTACALE